MARRKKTTETITDPVTVLKAPAATVPATSEMTMRGAIPAPSAEPKWAPPRCYYCECGGRPAKGNAPCCYVRNWRAAEIASMERFKADTAPTYREASIHLAAAKTAHNAVSFVRRMPDFPAVKVTITITAITGRTTVRGPYVWPETEAERLTARQVAHINRMLSMGLADAALLPVLANAFRMNPGVKALAKVEVDSVAA